jgi:signal transduction histidine kinase
VRQSDERAALIRQLDASRAEVSRLSHEAGVLAERQRLAGEIHDTIAQGLSSVVMLIQAAQAEPDRSRAGRHLTLAAATARDNHDEARALVAALTPPALDGSSLPDALRRLAGTLSVTGSPRPLPTPVEVVLLRSAQEALSNARKHAGAASVAVSLSYEREGPVVLEVRDDGAGFDVGSDTGGYGLRGMRSRVELVAGTLAVTSSPGAGTTVRVAIP